MQAALRRLVEHKTVITIAHRLSTIRDADRIIVKQDGTIAELGRHEQLLGLNGLYAAMWADYADTESWQLGGGRQEAAK